MTTVNLEDAINTNKPFTIKMDNGERFSVKHRDYIILSPSKRTALFFHPDDHFEIIDLEHVSSIKSKSH
jgi:hypothetical protein